MTVRVGVTLEVTLARDADGLWVCVVDALRAADGVDENVTCIDGDGDRLWVCVVDALTAASVDDIVTVWVVEELTRLPGLSVCEGVGDLDGVSVELTEPSVDGDGVRVIVVV